MESTNIGIGWITIIGVLGATIISIGIDKKSWNIALAGAAALIPAQAMFWVINA